MTPTDIKIGRRINGVAGQYAYNVTVTTPEEETYRTTFVSSIYGGGVYVILPRTFGQVRIDRAVVERCGGNLSPQFIRNFYTD